MAQTQKKERRARVRPKAKKKSQQTTAVATTPVDCPSTSAYKIVAGTAPEGFELLTFQRIETMVDLPMDDTSPTATSAPSETSDQDCESSFSDGNVSSNTSNNDYLETANELRTGGPISEDIADVVMMSKCSTTLEFASRHTEKHLEALKTHVIVRDKITAVVLQPSMTSDINRVDEVYPHLGSNPRLSSRLRGLEIPGHSCNTENISSPSTATDNSIATGVLTGQGLSDVNLVGSKDQRIGSVVNETGVEDTQRFRYVCNDVSSPVDQGYIGPVSTPFAIHRMTYTEHLEPKYTVGLDQPDTKLITSLGVVHGN